MALSFTAPSAGSCITGACRCGASPEEWCELPVLAWCPISVAIGERGGCLVRRLYSLPGGCGSKRHRLKQAGGLAGFLGVTHRQHLLFKSKLCEIPLEGQ